MVHFKRRHSACYNGKVSLESSKPLNRTPDPAASLLPSPMRWLPRLLSHAAAAGRASAARATSHVRGGSHGFASGGDGPAVPREWLRKLWAEELKRQKEAAKRWGIGGTGDSLGALASSEEPVLPDGRVMDEAPSRSYQYDDRDLKPVEASGFSRLQLHLLVLLFCSISVTCQ
jgi:hypothetical protein